MENSILVFARTILRGCGQVMFQNNAFTGLFFFAGIFWNSPLLGFCGLLGTLASTAAALVLKADQDLVRNGLFGFNGTLAGIALPFYLPYDHSLLVLVVLNGAFSTIIMAALLRFLEKWNIAPLTAPFVLSTWFFLLAAHAFHHITPGPLLTPAFPNGGVAVELGKITASMLWQGSVNGIGEVMFQDNIITSVMFITGLAVNSPLSALAGFLGSIGGLATAWMMGVPAPDLQLGLYGFNSVLCAIALFGVFYTATMTSGFIALAAVIMAAITTGAITVLLSPMGIPGLTGPFILVTWLFLFATKYFRTLDHTLPPDAAANPEAN